MAEPTPTPVPDPAISAESLVGTTIAISVSFAVVSVMVFGLRLYTRCALLKNAGSDDWTMLAAQVRDSTSFLPSRKVLLRGRLLTVRCRSWQ